jgi:hypothetical protein
MIKNFNFFVNEELRIEKMDLKTLETFKINLLTRLNEYRTYILANIEYNLLTNKIEYKDFDRIEIKVIIRVTLKSLNQMLLLIPRLKNYRMKMGPVINIFNIC